MPGDEKRVEIHLQAWPDAKRNFDRITSFGMSDCDARGNLQEYMQRWRRVLWRVGCS